MRNRITPEIGREQFGLVEDAGTRNAIFVLRMITEDYTKAFDKVRHNELFEDLGKLDLHGKAPVYMLMKDIPPSQVSKEESDRGV